MISLGPFPIPGLLALLAAASAMMIARRAVPADQPDRRRRASQIVMDALIFGLIAARLAFVAIWPRTYLDDPLAILRIGDGGLSLVTGALATTGYLLWRVKREGYLLRPVSFATIGGLGLWLAGSGLITLMHASVPLPTAALETLDGRATTLSDLGNKPLVVNLWATWCPPCRREMPTLAAAQRNRPDLGFAFVNQGEETEAIRGYLKEAGIELDNVLLDAGSAVMRETGTRGLPTTLFFDAQGRLVDSHVGELNQATLERKLQRTGVAP